MRQKTKNYRIKGSNAQNFFLFFYFPRHIPIWVWFVQKTWAKNSHAWAPLSTCNSLASKNWEPNSDLLGRNRVTWGVNPVPGSLHLLWKAACSRGVSSCGSPYTSINYHHSEIEKTDFVEMYTEGTGYNLVHAALVTLQAKDLKICHALNV